MADSELKEHMKNLANQRVEIIKNKLFFISTNQFKAQSPNIHVFDIDQQLLYRAFNKDFGPLNLACIYNYVSDVRDVLEDPDFRDTTLYHVTSTDYRKYTNSVFLVCCMQILVLGRTTQEAYLPFHKYEMKGFRDSSTQKISYEIKILDCLRAFQKAHMLNWFSLDNFNAQDYLHYDELKNADLNQIVKDKIYAFSRPVIIEAKNPAIIRQATWSQMAENFKKLGINVVIHLGREDETEKYLSQHGIKSEFIQCYDEVPTASMVQKFLGLIENTPKNIRFGVNCKTGLGKTGTFIACYLIKKFGFTGNEAIAWARLCRPGTIIGLQQTFLVKYYDDFAAAKLLVAKFLGEESPSQSDSRKKIKVIRKISLKESLLDQEKLAPFKSIEKTKEGFKVSKQKPMKPQPKDTLDDSGCSRSQQKRSRARKPQEKHQKINLFISLQQNAKKNPSRTLNLGLSLGIRAPQLSDSTFDSSPLIFSPVLAKKTASNNMGN